MRRRHLHDNVHVFKARPGVEARTAQETVCGLFEPLDVDWVTDDPGLVNCLNCIARVEKAAAGVTEDSVRTKARQMGWTRAVRRLIDTHDEEFRKLHDEETKLAIPVAMAREREFLEYMALHGE